MRRHFSLVFILLLLIISPHSQDFKELPEYERLYLGAEKLYNSETASEVTDRDALANYRQAIAILTTNKQYNKILADSYIKCGILQMMANQQEQAFDCFRGAEATVRQSENLSDSLLFQPYLYEGSIHYNRNNLDSAAWFFNKADAINNQYPGLSESERLFNKLGVLYYETGDYKKSITYFERALYLVEQASSPNVLFIVNYKNNIANGLMKLGEYNKAQEIFSDLLKYHLNENELAYNIGTSYMEEGNYEKALSFLRRMTELNAEKFSNLSKVFIGLGLYDSAKVYLAKATNSFTAEKGDVKKIGYGIVLKYSGDLKLATGDAAQAIADYQLAVNYLYPSFTDTSVNSNPSSFTGLQNFTLLFDALTGKAAAFSVLSKQQKKQDYLVHSLNAYSSALKLATHIERTYFSDDARLFLKRKVNPATQKAVAVAIDLHHQSKTDKHYLNTAFGFVENNKASVLQAGLQNLQLAGIAGIPTELLVREKNYQSLITKLRIQLMNTIDSAALLALQQKIQDNEIGLATVQKKLDENKVYHQLKFNAGTINLDSTQAQVKDDEVVLSYYYTATDLHCFYITKEMSGIVTTPLKDDLFSKILSLRKELENPQASGRKSLQDAGVVLYQYLVSPVLQKISTKKRLMVIPFNEISYVPFEMMVDDKEGQLLLNRFAVSYNYSASFIADRNDAQKTNYKVLAMAPFAETGNAQTVLPQLPSSGEEINGLPGNTLFGASAGKKEFVSLAGKYPIVHLATHAVADDADPLQSYVEFYGLKNDADTNHRLYEQEIYNLDMKAARLVILSACETGNGLLINGEGIMSLSRAFSYAGCKSVITSLWKADDVATSFIVKQLHHYLQKGMPKDEALQKAKIDYLKSDKISDRFKTPAYWAHLVLIGDSQSLVETGFAWYWYGAVILFVLFVLFLFIKKRAGHN